MSSSRGLRTGMLVVLSGLALYAAPARAVNNTDIGQRSASATQSVRDFFHTLWNILVNNTDI